MAVLVRMPEVLADSNEAVLVSWLVPVGSTVSVGDPLAEIETEKAMVEYVAEHSGVLARTLIQVGESAEVGAPIAIFSEAGDTEQQIDALLGPANGAAADAAAPGPNGPTVDAADSDSDSGSDVGRIFASPIVRKIARDEGVDLRRLVGTGPGGRIVRRDLEADSAERSASTESAPVAPPAVPVAPVAAPPVAPVVAASAVPGGSRESSEGTGYVDIPHTGMRRAIARRLTESTSTVPHFYLSAECRVDELLALRARVNETAPQKISVNDFIVKAAGHAFALVPEANVMYMADALRVFDAVDISVAMSTDKGLVTPVVRDVNRRTLSDVHTAIVDLKTKAAAGRLRQEEIEGGTFSISNLGMFGTREFTAIINPPQSAILAIGTARRAAVVAGEELVVGTVMSFTLSVDHRALDGALAAQWMKAFSNCIEDPLTILT